MFKEFNNINTKKLIGVNINKNMSVDTMIEKLSLAKNIDFSSEITAAKSIKELLNTNKSLFSNTLKLKDNLKTTQDSLTVAVNVYNKTNSSQLTLLDNLPIAGNGAPIQSQVGTVLTPLSNGLEQTKKGIDDLNKQIEENYSKISKEVESIRDKMDSLREIIINKIIDFSKKTYV